MCAAIPATSTPGRRAAQPAGATPKCCRIAARARAWRRATRSSSIPPRITPRAPSGSRCVTRYCRRPGNSSRRRVAAGIPKGDYNGRDRGGPSGVVSLTQYTMRDGRRSSTYQAFLAGEPEQRPNLAIITGAQATRVLLDVTDSQTIAIGVEYRPAGGETVIVHAAKEVILSAG